MCSLEKTYKSVWDEGLAGLLQNLVSTADALNAPLKHVSLLMVIQKYFN